MTQFHLSSNQPKAASPHHHHHHHHCEELPFIMVKANFLPVIHQRDETVPQMIKAPSMDGSSSCTSAAADHHQEGPASAPASPKGSLSSSSESTTSQQDLLQRSLRDEHWNRVEDLCEKDPSLARDRISMVCQGENSTCLPIHFAAGKKSTPVSTIDSLVTAHPGSLLAVESSGGRLALHIAVLKGASFAVVRYLCEAMPQTLGMADQEGNLPLHYAAMYSSDEIIQLLLKSHADGCNQANRSDRLPLHLLCARCWDRNAISMETVQAVLMEYPEALKCADRRGRLPLHVACSSQDPRADMIQLLVPAYPEALLARDQSKGTPLDLARKFSAGGGVVVAYLQDCSNKERRKKYKFLAPFKHVGGKIARRRHCKPDVDALHLHYCYG
ncbi:Ankyrin Repeat [Seminavis robusta]|uniref:Ankyrin Repeat n=1 Tax=Seminavis robusta TaxID=568900 RepID=A0A9N8HW93_9STRA|nr:Ankyrin Repeat [Seminavis robusta]|eukprot:Sro1938_g306530.1 Ankyrin Repeat (386) ;mRNA; r:13236-14393